MEQFRTNEYEQVSYQNKFLARVYGWMALALVISAATAFFTAIYITSNEQIFKAFYSYGYITLVIAELILVFWLSSSIRKISTFAASVGFIIYSILNGATLSSIFIVYNLGTIAYIFLISALMFVAMAVYGAVTKQNLMSFGRYFFMALIGIIIASLVNIFLRSSSLSWGISMLTVVLFTGLTAYDSQKMLMASRQANGNEVFKKAAIIGALELYLDFINIFLSLLRIFGRSRD